MESFGDRLRALRKTRKLSARALASQIGISPSYLCDIELGRRFPAGEVLEKFARALMRSQKELQGYDTRPPLRELKHHAEVDPAFGWALRKIVSSGVTGGELVKFVESRGRRKS